MSDRTFEIRFDKLGNIIIDDVELQNRLKYLLELNGELTLRLKNLPRRFKIILPPLQLCPPRPWPQPIPAPEPLPPNADYCPMTMCDPCGKLRMINDRAHQEQWEGIGGDPGKL